MVRKSCVGSPHSNLNRQVDAFFLAVTPTEVEAFTCSPVFWYYHGDHLGSSSVLTDRQGNVVKHYEYYAFGKDRFNDASLCSFDISNRYTGQVLDEETGLYYYNARYYDPEIGRFVQADSIVPSAGDPQTLNRYSYVRNNPLMYTDPSGHENFFSGLWNAATEQFNSTQGIVSAVLGGPGGIAFNTAASSAVYIFGQVAGQKAALYASGISSIVIGVFQIVVGALSIIYGGNVVGGAFMIAGGVNSIVAGAAMLAGERDLQEAAGWAGIGIAVGGVIAATVETVQAVQADHSAPAAQAAQQQSSSGESGYFTAELKLQVDPDSQPGLQIQPSGDGTAPLNQMAQLGAMP